MDNIMYCDVAQWHHIRRLILEKGMPKKQDYRDQPAHHKKNIGV